MNNLNNFFAGLGMISGLIIFFLGLILIGQAYNDSESDTGKIVASLGGGLFAVSTTIYFLTL